MKTKVIFERTGKNMEAIREEVIVNGEITKDGFAVMMAATNGDGTFVPAVVGLHEVNAADEAVYAKLVGIESCEANLIATCSADVLVGRFVNANGAWDELPVKGQAQSGTVRVGIHFVYGLYNFTPVRNGANKKISWWISRQGIGHALYCFTSNYTAEIGYQFQHVSSYISMFEEQFGTIDGKPASVQIPAGGRNVDAMRFKVYPNVGPAYIVEVPSAEVDNIDEWLSEHMESDATFVELKSTYSKGIAALLYGRGEDNTATIATLTYRNELCCECDSELCAFADASGICRAPFITGAAPRIHEDGCDDFCSKCDAGCTASVADKTSEAGRYMGLFKI